jgi:hypothetical protein
VQLGFLLMVIGFGSAVMHQFTGVQFPLLSWWDRCQPVAGMVVGVVGLAAVAVAAARRMWSRSGDRSFR